MTVISDPSIPLASAINATDFLLVDQVDVSSITGYRTRRAPGSLLSTISPAPNSTQAGLVVNQSIAGTLATFAEEYANIIDITSDNANYALGLNYFGVNASFGGSLLQGTRAGALFNLTQTAPNPANTSGFQYYIGVGSNVFMDGTGDGGTGVTLLTGRGGYYGANFTVRSTASNVLYNIGCEVNNFGTSAATQAYQIGINSLGFFVNQGNVFDAAFAAAMGASSPYGGVSPGPGWKIAYAVAELGNGYNPLDATNGVAFGGHVEALSTIPCKYVLDLRAFTATTAQMIGTGISIDPAGQPTFGAGTGKVIGAVNGAATGSGNGALWTIQNNGSTFGAFGNISAELGGSFSAVMGVFGFSGLNLYTNNALAISIDTGQNVTHEANTNSIGVYQSNGTQVVGARRTGWTVATGTPSRATFTTSGVTLPTLAGVVMAMEQDLIAHGLLGT